MGQFEGNADNLIESLRSCSTNISISEEIVDFDCDAFDWNYVIGIDRNFIQTFDEDYIAFPQNFLISRSTK